MAPAPTVFDIIRALVMGSSDARIVSACVLSEAQREAARAEGRFVALEGSVAIVLVPGTTLPAAPKPS